MRPPIRVTPKIPNMDFGDQPIDQMFEKKFQSLTKSEQKSENIVPKCNFTKAHVYGKINIF